MLLKDKSNILDLMNIWHKGQRLLRADWENMTKTVARDFQVQCQKLAAYWSNCPKCPEVPGRGNGAGCPLPLFTVPCEPLAEAGKQTEAVPHKAAEPKYHSCCHIVLVILWQLSTKRGKYLFINL